MTENRKPFGLIAAIAILLMAVAAGFAYGYVQSSLLADDAQTTVQNVQNSPGLLKAGILAWVVVLVCDLVVCWALYHYFKHVHRSLSLLSSGLRLVYSGWLAVAIAQLVYLLPLLNNPDQAAALQVMQQFASFEEIWSAGLIVFGLHLLALAYLSLLSQNIPRIFGWLLLFAGFSYLFVHTGKWLFPGARLIDQLETLLSLPMAVGELAFALWLLIRSRNVASPQFHSVKKELIQVHSREKI
ncbi:hypothetical protein OKW21_006111 [Catalinimonas alkaloidigena]|uniref:DUF4386 domain-containing protein n=1 Tax=Catalinimonas alkaloidigena TaxID=1075417 RepID=UPI0024066A54|nr:DUF4386 domain-containing protein [Catalinimonas alkaloidigena]MDF9800848.1 hypothetical protein [Catalinimonas alkaloidigena]